MMGSPKRVMRMGSRVRRTLSRTIRHVALNFEIAILRSVLRLQKRADHATVIDYGDNPLRTLQPPSVKVVPAAQVFSRPARVGRDFSANLSEDLRAEVRRGREFFQVTLQCLVLGGRWREEQSKIDLQCLETHGLTLQEAYRSSRGWALRERLG